MAAMQPDPACADVSIDNTTVSETSVTGAITYMGSGTLTITGGGNAVTTVTVSPTDNGVLNLNYSSGTNTFNSIGSSSGELALLAIGGTGVTSAGSVVAAALSFGADGTLNITGTSGGSNIGTVQVSTGNTGTLTLSNTSGTNTFGTIGGSLTPLYALNIDGDGGTVAVTGDTFATTVTIGNGATLSSLGYITGNVNVSSGGTLSIGATGNTLTGALANNGTLSLGTNTLAVSGNITGTDAIIRTTLGSLSTGYGYIDNNESLTTTNATFSNALTIEPFVASGAPIVNGSKVVLIMGDTSKSTVSLGSIVPSFHSGGFSWTATTGSGGTDVYGNPIYGSDIVLTAATFNAANVAGVNPILATGANGLDRYTGSNADVQALQEAEGALTSSSDLNKAGAQLSPQVNGVRQISTFGVVNAALDTLLTRNYTLRVAQIAKSGVASGEAFDGYGFWAQGFGSFADQGAREGVDGFNSTSGGAAFGGDTRVNKNVRVGALFAYANTNVNETGNLTGSGMKINSYIGTAYGSYTGKRWYVDGNMTFGYHDYNTTRLVNFSGATSQTAQGSFSGEQYGAGAEVGYPLLAYSKTIVTPYASLTYNYLTQDSYTETGAPGADLTVNSSDTSSLRSGLGTKISVPMGSAEDWSFTPNAHLAWMHEFFDDAPTMTSSFAGGSPFSTPGIKMAQEAGVAGVGLDMKSTGGLAVSAKYDFEVRDHYLGNNFMLQLRQSF
jgi:outer membrane autotransporter protein